MSTRALIAIREGFPHTVYTYRGISLHFDGNIEFAGQILKKHYTTDFKVKKLIALGNLESLAPTLKKCEARGDEAIETGELDELFRCFDWEYAYVFEKMHNLPEWNWYVHYIKMVREEL